MYYYSIDYKTIPPISPASLPREIGNAEFESGFLFSHQDKLNDIAIRSILETDLKNNKISYTELIITNSEEITEEDYISRTQYS